MASNTRSFGDYNKVPQESVRPDSISSARQDEAKKSWKALYTMTIGLLCGVVLAVGHHLLYQHLDGQPIDNIVLPQAWAFRMGNLLAFLVKLSLAITVGVAFVQRQWHMLRQQSFTVKDVDALTDILANILRFLDSFLWLKYPLLTATAIICWLLPLLPIVVPGTLTVVSAEHPIKTTLEVPQLNVYNDLQWTDADNYRFLANSLSGASLLSQIVFATATGGQILSIPAYFLNETYHIEFNGPAVNCTMDTNQTFLSQVEVAAIPGENNPWEVVYLSWVGGDDSFALSTELNTLVPKTLDTSSTDVNRLFIIPSSDMLATATECRFYNAVYSVDFAYSNGEQQVTIQNVTYLDPLCYNNWHDNLLDYSDLSGSNHYSMLTAQERSYLGLVEKFGSLFVGKEVDYTTGNTLGLQTMFTAKNMLHIDLTAGVSEVQSKIEELFQNITVSLLSRAEFWVNSTEPCGNESTLSTYKNTVPAIAEACEAISQESKTIPVTIFPWLLTYEYEPFALYLTYGLALLLSFGCFVVGCHAFRVNHGSYSNSFSTFVRVATSSELQLLVDKNDNGRDPRPEKLASAMVDMNTSGR